MTAQVKTAPAKTKTAAAKTKAAPAKAKTRVTKLPSQRVTGHASASLSTHVQVKAEPGTASRAKTAASKAKQAAPARKPAEPQAWLWIASLVTDEIVKAKYLGLPEEVFRIRKEDGSLRRKCGGASLVNPTRAQLDKLSEFAEAELAKPEMAKYSHRKAAYKRLVAQVAKVQVDMAGLGIEVK